MDAQDLVGVWIIRSFHLVDRDSGTHSAPWGEHPFGTLMFHPGGRMFALITPERAAPTTVSEQAAAFQNMLAYSGAYRIDPPDRLVTTVDMSWFAPWLGTEQIRFCKLEGDDL